MEAIHGTPPIIGYAVSIEDLKVDYNLYDSMYKASLNGQTMPKDQLKRYMELKAIFEGAQNGQAQSGTVPK